MKDLLALWLGIGLFEVQSFRNLFECVLMHFTVEVYEVSGVGCVKQFGLTDCYGSAELDAEEKSYEDDD